MLSFLFAAFLYSSLILVAPLRLSIAHGFTLADVGDLLGGVFLAFAHLNAYQGRVPAIVMLLALVKCLGHGAHAVANSSDIWNSHESSTRIGQHLYFVHETLSHYITYTSEWALWLYLVWASRGTAFSEQRKALATPSSRLYYAVMAVLHALAAAFISIGTRTTPALVLFAVVILSTSSVVAKTAGSHGIVQYARLLFATTLLVVGGWYQWHGHTMPTFDDLRNTYNTS